ncbi:Thioesterase/thiol ester dehydrase-isomerase [Aspergillus californicus]
MIRTQPLRSSRLAFASLPPQHSIPLWRPFSASSRSNNAQAPARSSPKDTKRKPFDIDAQWLPNTKREIGRCLDFGLKPKEITEAGELLQEISRDWRELKAGSEGYLTDVARRGLFQQSVAWGEMPMQYPDQITVYHKIRHHPYELRDSPSSFHLQVMILSEKRQRPAAWCDEEVMTYDYKLGKKARIPPWLMDQLLSTWELQEQAKKHWQQRISEIDARVRSLELASWNPEGRSKSWGSNRSQV